ncbi:MAG: sulfide/dihydroorotate dehydrogenase-like FAD/NAD-binding protein [Odoribacteraceae bacterium]|jgi:NAD(P)H-flavin reductase|nr:sulfide/dihydroorotate dehydrogenase-like FAD/NAD-binding protein [Odoribacteraceae bacterium]
MNKILGKTYFSERVVKLEVEAPLIAKARRPGNFVIVRVGERGERVPLTIAGADTRRGSITLVVQVVGASSRKLCALEVGDHVTDLVGPLGKPTRVERVGTVLACGGGVGIAPLLPIAGAFKEAGNRVVSVIAARTREFIILEEEIRACSDEVIVMTDDGSYGNKGVITTGMEAVIVRERVELAVTIGPAIMMKFAAALTRRHAIPTIASLNALMVDGTGMCGACRVTVGGKTRFTCVDGPEFDAHEVDFDEMLARLDGLRDEERNKDITSV